MVTAASTTGIRFAPEDPSLPPPWRALVDDNTGYVYYWNTQTGDTTYNRPTVPATPGGVNFTAIGNGVQPLPENGASANGHANGSNGSMYVTKNAVVEQPKLAAIPILREQQITSGALHAPIGAVNGISSGSSLAMGSYKRSADTFDYSDRDAYKRPRTQGVLCSSFDTESYRRQHEITVLGDNVPPPFITFDSVGLSPEVLRELQIAGFTAPTPIQAQSWPVALLGRDIVAIAKTGSGKTLGYLLPAFLHLESRKNNSRLGPTVLVLAPTRELATQIHDEAMKFGRSSRLTSTCVYGGAPKGPQLRDIERGCDIIIATPGRLNDFLEMRKISLRQVSYLVLDEADRMLDMGFEPQIRKIVNEVPSRRQTLMYTATWPKDVRKIAADLLVSPVQVNIGNTDDLSANKAITQCVEVVLPQDKLRRLEQILRNLEPGSKIIIFCSTKRMCDQLARGLRRDFTALAIHGDKSQSERDWVLSQFKSGKSPVLVATDVAARGLDIKDIRAVINYDFPTGVEDYVHRIGRTGRAGASGLAYTFFSEQDAKYGRELIKVLEGANQKVPLELREMAARGGYGKPRGGRWDSGGRGGGRGGFGGRGDGGSFGGRGPWNGGRSGNSGAFENGDIVNREKARYGDREKKRSKSPGRARSYSRSPTGSRSRSHEKSRGRSRSPHARHQENSYHGGSSWQW